MNARLARIVLLAALCLAPASAWAQSASQLYYERAVMSAAGARCGLFDSDLSSALAAAQMQARNAALRGGSNLADLNSAQGRAQVAANAAPCQGQDLKLAAQRVRDAFKAYAGLRTMTFPGDVSNWRAVRNETVSNSAWRLFQPAVFGPDRIVVGLGGRQGHDFLAAVATFSDGASPYAARIVLRDTARAPTAYIGSLTGKAPLSARLPPPTATRAILAEARGPAETAMLPQGMTEASAFRFPASAVQAMAQLDPREAISVDFVFAGPNGDVVRRAFIEVGDFAAGVAFLRSGQR